MSGSERRVATVEKREQERVRKGATEPEERELVRVKLRCRAKWGWLGVSGRRVPDMQHGEECGRGKE